MIVDEDINIYEKLMTMILPKDASKYFEVSKNYKNVFKKQMKIEGWNIYNPLKEYERQKINLSDKVFLILLIGFKI